MDPIGRGLQEFFSSRYGLSEAELGPEFELRQVLDSLAILELLEFIRERMGAAIDPADLNSENLSSLGSLDRLIRVSLERAK